MLRVRALFDTIKYKCWGDSGPLVNMLGGITTMSASEAENEEKLVQLLCL
jgi:hypothetical protein